jgi:hypothetical protein
MIWNRIAVLHNADGARHKMWPEAVGIEYDYTRKQTRGFAEIYAIWMNRMRSEAVFIAFYACECNGAEYQLLYITRHESISICPCPALLRPLTIVDTGTVLFRDTYPLTDEGLSELPPSLTGDELSVDPILGREAVERGDD